MMSFGVRLREVVAQAGHLCVGIDPHAHLLDDWGLPQSAQGVRDFGLRVVDAATSRAGVIKPQIAFFERFGSAGFAALEEVIGTARHAGLIVIADVKRGDMGTSMDGYGDAWLAPGAPLEVDAITANAYQGLGVMQGALRYVQDAGKGVFVLAATSNPEAFATQSARLLAGGNAGLSVAEGIAREVSAWNAAQSAAEWGGLGLVIGATVDWHALGLTRVQETPCSPILAPGFGFQGAVSADFERLYGRAAEHTLASESRSILSAGPRGLAEAISSAARSYRRGAGR